MTCVKVAKCQGTVLADSPLCLEASSYHCTACGCLYPATTVLSWLSSAVSAISHLARPSVDQCELTLHLLSLRLHPGHHLLLQLKQKLSGLYGGQAQLTRPARERRLQLLMDILESNSKVSPLRASQSFLCWGILGKIWIFSEKKCFGVSRDILEFIGVKCCQLLRKFSVIKEGKFF